MKKNQKRKKKHPQRSKLFPYYIETGGEPYPRFDMADLGDTGHNSERTM